MKRNSFLVLCSLLLAMPTLYAQKTTKVTKVAPQKKIKNIIFMIGDGMGTAQIYAGLTANKGSLNLEKCKVIGFSKTNSTEYITESAAGATAFAIGQKTYNGAIGVDSLGKPQPTILEIAERNGLSTGLVATSSITHATPASFIAHQPSRKLDQEIAGDFLKTDIDVFIGGGKSFFTKRKDGRDLTKELQSKGYQVLYDIDQIAQVRNGKLAGLIADEQPPRWSAGRGDQLMKSAKTAIRMLDQNDKGFFLMIEGSQIDWGGHANDSQYIIEEMLDFDRVIGEVLAFAEKDGETLVVITADHETGGYALLNGNLKTGTVEAKFSTGDHTGVMVPVFAYGPGAEAFMGIYHNNTLFEKFMNAFQFTK